MVHAPAGTGKSKSSGVRFGGAEKRNSEEEEEGRKKAVIDSGHSFHVFIATAQAAATRE